MLYESKAREGCVAQLVKDNISHKIMIFHEDVNSLNHLHDRLSAEGVPSSIIHYKEHKACLEDFKANKTRVLLSVRMFSEGVDLPDVDVGIIAAASSSVRQKIQTMGRILRKSEGKSKARIINLFIKDTTDESVFSKVDWDKILGKEVMRSYSWPDLKEIELKHIQKRRYRSNDEEDKRISEGKLKPGEEYTAMTDGQKLAFDSSWKLFRHFGGRREYATNQDEVKDIMAMVRPLKPEGGSFFMDQNGRVIVKITSGKEQKVVYAGTAQKKPIF
jgi:superfamily II DNA or RNA helicase